MYPHLAMTIEHMPNSPTSAHHPNVLEFSYPPVPEVGLPDEPRSIMDAYRKNNASAIPRFLHLLKHSKLLVATNGVYTTYAGTTVFSRAPLPPTNQEEPTIREIALSLAAAQDCANSAQVEGPAEEDLTVFKQLWEATIEVVDSVLETGNLDHETLGWGIYGLAAGHMHEVSWRDNSLLLSLKTRLHDGLLQLPNMDTQRKRPATTLVAAGRVEVLAKANRNIHICANLLLQQFRREEWNKTRWYHGVAVAERWIRNLGLDLEVGVGPGET